MERLIVAVLLVAVAIAVAVVVDRRRPDAPTQGRWAVPTQLDRSDFDRPDVPWLVVVFSSVSCQSCAATVAMAEVLVSDDVAVVEVEATAQPALHRRYAIDAVPLVVVADAEGVVRASYVGPPTAADLWAVLAELREPGASPEPGLGTG